MKKWLGVLILSVFPYTSLVSSQDPTKILIYQPFTQKNVLNPNLIVAQRYPGTCWTHSVANPGRTDAWRCHASNVVLDPCYEDDTGLVCIVSPWAHKATILELKTPIHKQRNKRVHINSFSPWALELENGHKCIYLTGATSVVAGMRMNYTCGSYRYTVIGGIDRSTSVWKVNVYDFHRKTIDKQVIKAAWF